MASRNYFRKFVGKTHHVVLISLFVALAMSGLVWADTLHIMDDAHIDLGSPSDNMGSSPNLEVSNIVSRKSGEKYTYVSYELLPLPDGASLEHAYLRLYVGKVYTAGLIDLYLVTQAWDEEGINGLVQPTLEALPFTDFAVTDTHEGHYVTVDVTPEVQLWLEGSADNYGFALIGNPVADVTVSFDSKENPQTSHSSELELILGVAEGGVDSTDIEDGSITTDDIADNSITGTDILDGTIAAADIDKDEVQLRVNGTCAAGSSIRVIDNMGNVTCEPDDDSGDITSVYPSAGGGLNGGADSGDAELGIAPDGVNSSMIADGTVGASDVDSNGVQLRVNGSCPASSSIRVIASDGSVTCEADTNSGGDITSVFPSAGGGLTGGASSGDAELGVAPGGITSLMIADGGILGTDVRNTEVQLRVTTQCPPGSSIRSINATGTASCEVDDFEADTTLDPDLFWKLAGNSATNPKPVGLDFLGTTDDTDLVLGVNGQQAMRFEYVIDGAFYGINVIGGLSSNKVVGAIGGTVGGGGAILEPNKVEANFGTISGGTDNGVLGVGGVIGGGQHNTSYQDLGTIGGGYYNIVNGSTSTVSGGRHNSVEGADSSISGGVRNFVSASGSNISGGDENSVYRRNANVGGGFMNTVCDPAIFDPDDYDVNDGASATIAGGSNNRTCGSRSFIGGGFANTATDNSSMIIGGAWNRANGRYSLVAGHFSTAEEDYGIALGHHAKSLHEGAFVWSDASSIADFESLRDNQFHIGATGGARFDLGDDAGSIPGGGEWVDLRAQGPNTFGNVPAIFRVIDTSTGAYLSVGGGWVNSSDRNRKTGFDEVDVRRVLEQLVSMPIQSWRYKVEGEQVRHIGPMAQDFHAVFGYGGDPKGIMSVDADGVALAAIQALYQVTLELEQRTRELELQTSRIESLEASFEELKAQMAPFTSQRHLTGLSN